METSCPFCNLLANRIVLASQYALAFADSFPVTEGHTLVIPIRHVASIYDLTAAEQADLWELVRQVRLRLRKKPAPDGFNIGVNDGPAAGQTIDHAHIHVIPRRQGDVPDPRGGIRWVIPDKANYWSQKL
jgi:diadenosine tetraphosphate (Ap4A) HIT family hydrolase